MSPFFANYGYQPETQWIRPPQSQAEFTNPASELLIARWQGIWNHLQENIYDAQQCMAKWYNAKVKDQPSFKVSDMVMIDVRHFSTKHPSKNLNRIEPRGFPGIGKNLLCPKSSMARSSG
jgi:hypothetical protein